jgi:hypothetical protein
VNTHTAISTTNITSFYYFLSFWTLKDNYFKKEQVLKRGGEEAVADIYLSIDPGEVNDVAVLKQWILTAAAYSTTGAPAWLAITCSS